MAVAEQRPAGRLTRISGPMVAAAGMPGVTMGEIVRVGHVGIMGEVIRIEGETAHAQVFEETGGLYLGEPVVATGLPLSVELGPGLLGQTVDGIQRPLAALEAVSGPFIGRGMAAKALNVTRPWYFTPAVAAGGTVAPGDILGTTPESRGIEHRILVPPGAGGTIRDIVGAGEYTITDTLATLTDGTPLTMVQRWPVKRARPVAGKLPPREPFLTGQRVLDCLFPIPLGGAAIVPGGFGTGKTVVEQTLAKFCNADVIVYVGCGERGNEMADVLTDFPDLKDPKTGSALMERTVLVVNTSNMPVAARDASVYTGITIAEYYRDQGYNVALMADSTSRWAEALREIAARLDEMPGEEGYPPYLAARVADFYERAGRVACLTGSGERVGSLTLVGAVSPPGGDFSEPVTQASLRVAGALWALDAALAYRRHYPAINWNRSYSLYYGELEAWFADNAPEGWGKNRQAMAALLQRDAELQEVVQLVGPDALQDAERLTLEAAKLVREVFLQQNAFSEADAYCSLEKSAGLLETLLGFYQECRAVLERGVPLKRVLDLPIREDVARLRDVPNETFESRRREAAAAMSAALKSLNPNRGL